MNRESRILAENLLQNLPEVDRAIDVLAAHHVTTYSLLILQERLFNTMTGTVEHKSDYLAGAHAVLQILNDLPLALASTRKDLDKKKVSGNV